MDDKLYVDTNPPSPCDDNHTTKTQPPITTNDECTCDKMCKFCGEEDCDCSTCCSVETCGFCWAENEKKTLHIHNDTNFMIHVDTYKISDNKEKEHMCHCALFRNMENPFLIASNPMQLVIRTSEDGGCDKIFDKEIHYGCDPILVSEICK